MERSCTGRQVVGLLWMLSLLILGWPVGIASADHTRLKPSAGGPQPTPQASHSVTPQQAAVAPAEAGANAPPLATKTTARQANNTKRINNPLKPIRGQHRVGP